MDSGWRLWPGEITPCPTGSFPSSAQRNTGTDGLKAGSEPPNTGTDTPFPCSAASNSGTVAPDSGTEPPNSSTVRPNSGAGGAGASLKGANLGTGVPKWITVWNHNHREISHGRLFAEAG